jgi:WD40 repeat protein
LTNNTVQIYDSELEGPIHTVKEDTPAKSAHLCRNGKYFFVHFSNNDIFLYDTYSGKKIQKIIGAPYCTKTVKFSGNGEKIIYGNTQLLCLWDILEGTMAMRTENWRNINCYDVNYAGDQIALGTYNGSIFVVSFVARTRCAQIEIKRHQHCIMAICYHKDKIVSVSHGGHLLISTITSNGGEKTISYVDKTLEHVPRMIESCGDVFYMFDRKGMFWQNPMGKMVGFVDGKSYRVIRNQNK